MGCGYLKDQALLLLKDFQSISNPLHHSFTGVVEVLKGIKNGKQLFLVVLVLS